MSDDRSDDDAAEYDPFDDDGSEDDPFGDDASEDDPFGDDASEDDPFDDETFAGRPGDEAGDGLDGSDAGGVDDPFAALGEGVGDDAGPDRDEGRSGERGETRSGADPEPGAPADDPFAELDADAADGPTDGDPFESMGSGDVGEEDVWAALDEGTAVGSDATDLGDTDGPTPGTPGAAATGDERVVDKRSYCQRCPHFAAPPETACTHEGTEIVESVDFSQFRVRNCPMVEADDPAFDGE